MGGLRAHRGVLSSASSDLVEVSHVPFPARGWSCVRGGPGRDWRFSHGSVTDFPTLPLQVSDKFAFGLFDLDWDVFTQHIEGAINRVPVLEKTGIKSTVCGPGEWGG